MPERGETRQIAAPKRATFESLVVSCVAMKTKMKTEMKAVLMWALVVRMAPVVVMEVMVMMVMIINPYQAEVSPYPNRGQEQRSKPCVWLCSFATLFAVQNSVQSAKKQKKMRQMAENARLDTPPHLFWIIIIVINTTFDRYIYCIDPYHIHHNH